MRLKENFFDDEAMKIMEGLPDGYLYSNILLKMYLASLKTEGRLMLNNVIPYNAQMIASVTGHQVGTVEKALRVFKDLGLIEILDNGAIYMLNIQNFIGQTSNIADRQREYDRRIASDKKSSRNLEEISKKSPPEIEIEKKTELEIEKKEKKAPAEPSVATVVADSGLSEEVKEALREFSKMRTKIKAGMTPNAMKLLIGNLLKLSEDPAMQVAILNQSIEKSWKGVYPLKDDAAKTAPKQEPKKQTGAFYRMDEHPHDARTDSDVEKALVRRRPSWAKE